jgi:hypothetical protein
MKPDYITLNGSLFARTEKLLVESLFTPVNGRTACGTYLAHKTGILFRRPNAESWIYLSAHERTPFLVSCHDTPEGVRFMFSLSTLDERALSMPEGYAAGLQIAADTWKQVNQPAETDGLIHSVKLAY